MLWLEVFGFVTGGLCVLLAARRIIWTFPLGLANNLVFVALFAHAALYADAGLQLVYIGLGIAGWIGWSSGRAEDDRAATVPTPRRAVPVLAVGFATLAALLHTWTDSTTELADATTTSGSLLAQYMMNRRWIQHWLVWIVVDLGYIGLYLSKGLWITATLYLIFVGCCGYGLRVWPAAPHRVAEPVTVTA